MCINIEKKLKGLDRVKKIKSLSSESRGGTMKTVTLEVRDLVDSMADFTRAWKTGKSHPELLWKVLTAKRWELINGIS